MLCNKQHTKKEKIIFASVIYRLLWCFFITASEKGRKIIASDKLNELRMSESHRSMVEMFIWYSVWKSKNFSDYLVGYECGAIILSYYFSFLHFSLFFSYFYYFFVFHFWENRFFCDWVYFRTSGCMLFGAFYSNISLPISFLFCLSPQKHYIRQHFFHCPFILKTYFVSIFPWFPFSITYTIWKCAHFTCFR